MKTLTTLGAVRGGRGNRRPVEVGGAAQKSCGGVVRSAENVITASNAPAQVRVSIGRTRGGFATPADPVKSAE